MTQYDAPVMLKIWCCPVCCDVVVSDLNEAMADDVQHGEHALGTGGTINIDGHERGFSRGVYLNQADVEECLLRHDDERMAAMTDEQRAAAEADRLAKFEASLETAHDLFGDAAMPENWQDMTGDELLEHVKKAEAKADGGG